MRLVLRILATILEKCKTKTFESSTAFIKATQIKRDESDSQSRTKVLYHQRPLQILDYCKLIAM